MSVMTEEECLRRIKAATESRDREIRGLEDALKKAEFRAAIAEWAVAGVVGYNFRMVMPDYEQRMQSLLDAADHAGRRAGAEFLHRAGLEFTQHAKMSEMLATVNFRETGHMVYDVHAIPDRSTWPLPFGDRRK